MKIKIYNEVWTIKEVSENVMEREGKVGDDNKIAWGLCRYNRNTILLLNLIKGVRLRAVLVHELTHAINFITMKYHNDFTHEEVCDYIATHIDEINRVVKEYLKRRNVK